MPGTAGAGRLAPAAGFDAIVLAGGRGRRAGGPGKPSLRVAGRPLLAWVVAAAAGAGARQVVVVGPVSQELLTGQPVTPGGLVSVQEEPPGAGPVPALRRGLAEVTAPAVALLAADLPFLRPWHLTRLLAAAGLAAPEPSAAGEPDAAGEPAGAVLTDGEGRPQWLAGCWRTARLRAATAAYGGNSLHGLLGPLAPQLLRYDLAAGEAPPWLDCDTPEDLRRAREWQPPLAGPARTGEEGAP